MYGRRRLPDRWLSRGGGEWLEVATGDPHPKTSLKNCPAGAGRQHTWPTPEGHSELPPGSAGPPAASRTEVRVPVPTHLHVCFRVCAWCARVRLGLSVHVRVCYVCLHKHTLRTTRPDWSEGGLRKPPLCGQGWAFVDRVWRKVTRTRPGVWEAHGRRAQAQPHPEAPVSGAGGGEAGVALRSKERPAHRPAIGEGGGFL